VVLVFPSYANKRRSLSFPPPFPFLLFSFSLHPLPPPSPADQFFKSRDFLCGMGMGALALVQLLFPSLARFPREAKKTPPPPFPMSGGPFFSPTDFFHSLLARSGSGRSFFPFQKRREERDPRFSPSFVITLDARGQLTPFFFMNCGESSLVRPLSFFEPDFLLRWHRRLSVQALPLPGVYRETYIDPLLFPLPPFSPQKIGDLEGALSPCFNLEHEKRRTLSFRLFDAEDARQFPPFFFINEMYG